MAIQNPESRIQNPEEKKNRIKAGCCLSILNSGFCLSSACVLSAMMSPTASKISRLQKSLTAECGFRIAECGMKEEKAEGRPDTELSPWLPTAFCPLPSALLNPHSAID